MTFPLLYHAHHTRNLEDLPFWRSLARQQGGPILELGCGTGRVSAPLAIGGNTPLVGLDRDHGMLAVLQQYLPAEAAGFVHVFQADMAAFRLAAAFPLVIMPCNTFSTLTETTRQATLARVVAHLQPGGVFAAGVPNPVLLKSLPAHSEAEVEDEFYHPESGNPVQVSSAWRRSPQRFTLHWHYDHLLPDGQVQRTSAETHHALLSVEAYRHELAEAGLSITAEYGSFNRTPFDPQASLDYIFVATRP